MSLTLEREWDEGPFPRRPQQLARNPQDILVCYGSIPKGLPSMHTNCSVVNIKGREQRKK